MTENSSNTPTNTPSTTQGGEGTPKVGGQPNTPSTGKDERVEQGSQEQKGPDAGKTTATDGTKPATDTKATEEKPNWKDNLGATKSSDQANKSTDQSGKR